MRMKGNSLQNCERQDHFGIRKLTIGAASVLLGTTLWLTNANEIVHADENENSSDSEPKEADKSNISAPVIDDNTKVQVQPQNSQSQPAIESNEQNKKIQAESSVNEKAASLATVDSKQVDNNQANQNIASSKDDKTAENEQNKQTATGQNSETTEQNSSAEKASSVWHQQAQTVQKQINQGTDKAIQNAQSNSLQLQENNENNEPDWQKIDLTKGDQVSDLANFKAVKNGVVNNADLQNDKNSNQVINHHDYQNFIDQSGENDSLINNAKKGANSGSSLDKVKQIIVQPENQPETVKKDPLNLLTATFNANKKKALSLADKALANKLLFADSKVSDDTESDTDSEPDNPSGPINPVDPTKPVEPDGPVNPESPTTPSQPTAAPSQPTNAPSDQKVTDTIVFIDDTTSNNLKQYKVEGMPGEKVNDHLGDLQTVADTIKTYTDHGYRLVSNDYQDTFGDANKTYNVHLAHQVVVIDKNTPYGNPVTASVTRKVNYTVDGVPDSTLPSHTETANFSATGHYDLVEHKLVDMVGGKEQVTNGKVDDGHLTWTVDSGTQDSSTLTGYAVPTKDGYHVNGVTVDPAADKDANADDTGLVKDLSVDHNSHDVTVTINLMRDINNDTIYVDYHDEQGQTVGNRQVITGPIGQTISVATGVPDGWQVKPNTPFNYDFEKDYTLVTVTVDPVQAVINPDDVTPDKPFKGTDLHNENSADVIPGTQNRHITGDITYDDLHKEVQRSIVIVDPNGAVDKNAVIQTVDFKRDATINAVTGKITFGQWQADGKDNFKAVSIPIFKGYTASQTSVASVNNVASDFEDPHLMITYTANDNQQNIKYEDANGQVIASQVIKGKTDQNVAVKANIPDGWQLAPNEKVPSEVKIAGGDTVVKIVPVESHIDPDTITPSNPLTTNNVLPGTTSKHSKQAITYQDLHKDVNRTITIKNPDGTDTPIVQTVHFKRPATVNAATGNITFDQWTTEDGNNLPSVQVPVIPGYTASQTSVAAVNNVAPDYSDPNLQIVYTPDEGQQTINYTDDQGNLIATQVVKGKTDQKINLSPEQIDGYHVVKSPAVPKEITIKAKDQAVNVIVVPNKAEIKASDITPTKSIKSTDVLPGTTSKHAKQDITYNDLHKTVSRQITVSLPSGQKQTINQVVHFQRNASVNDATGEVSYGQWQTDGNSSLAAVNLPQVSGYLPTGNVPAINDINSDDQDQQLNISYVKDTPTNRLKIAAANLAASQSAQEANNKRLAQAKKNQEVAHQAYEANQKDLQKQSALVAQLNGQALSAQAYLTSLMADNSSSVAAKKARKNLAVLMAKVVAANQRIEQDQQAISKQKDKATQAQSTIDSLVKKKKSIDDQINQLEKDMPEAAQVLDELKKQKGYQINLNQDYIKAVSQYVAGAKKDYDKSEKIKDINDDANLNNSFHQALANSGQGILANIAKNYETPGAVNLQEEKNQIDLSKILSAENSAFSRTRENTTEDGTWNQLNWQTTIFAFNLLNEVRDQLGLPELTLNEKTIDLAKEIAQNYVRDGRSHYNTHGHDAKAVNDAASANDLDSVSNYEGDDPYNSHKQYYESLDGGSAQNRLEIVVPKDNGSYGITFVVGPKSQNSYETNLDSVKQVIFTNLLEMLINDGTTWGHTIQLLNIGPYQDYSQINPIYRFGASMHLLRGEFNVDNLAKYTNHYIVVPPNFIDTGKEGEFAAKDIKNVPKDTFNPAALTAQQQKYLDEANKLSSLQQEKAAIERQISQQSLARDGANDLVNKLQVDLKLAQSEKDGLNGQQTDAQNTSKEADEKLAEHEQAVKDAQSKLKAAQKAAQEAEAKKEEMEHKADAVKIKADESDQEVKNQTSQSEQTQQQTKIAALIYQQAQNTGASSSNDSGSSNDAAKEDNGAGNNSAAKNDQPDLSANSDADEDEPDEPDQSDDNDDDDGDEADEDNSASTASDNGVQGESSAAAHHGNVYSDLVHSAKSQNSQAASDTANSFHEQNSTLPQTGESEKASAVAALAGAAAVSISLIGLAGVRKRKRI